MSAEHAKVEMSFDRDIQVADLLPLFAQTDWAATRSADLVERMLASTPIKLGVWSGHQLVGFSRVLTDDVFRALIDDVVVDAPLRGRGLGTRMMDLLADRLAHVEQIFLRCGPDVVSFYERNDYRQRAICLDLIAGRRRV